MAMMRSGLFWWCSLVVWTMLMGGGGGVELVEGAGGDEEVRYDGRSLIINGQRKLLFSGSIHYPRSTPQLWPSLISKAKEGGLDVIQTYVFWNLHEPQQGQYDFRGRRDLVRFIKEVAAQGLYVSLRVGPFIEAEWAYGGLPFWLHDIRGIVFRSDNEPFKMHMQSFTSKIVNMMKSEKLYASQGGPIILSQIENEYQNVEKAFREKGPSYVKWAAEMVVGLQTGVPWIMCKQEDAPDPVINACNGLKCGMKFVPNSPNKPSIWAENWTSQYQVYGEIARSRSPEDIAFHVALFVAKNGSFVNYYMYHGGTNFGRAASAYVTTSYYDEAPLDEYGMKRQPKWGHLMELHAAIKQCTNALLGGAQNILPLGQQQTAYVFRENSGECAAFLVNIDKVQSVSVSFQSSFYNLPPKSISILPNCKDVSFNTAKVNTPYSTRSMVPVKKFNAAEMWVEFREAIPNYEDTSTRSKMLLEQMNTTKDVSDYLWYTFRFRHQFGPSTAILNAYSLGHVLHAFVNGVHVGSAHGSHSSRDFTLETAITLNNGINRVALLSAMVGLPDAGAYMERKAAGIRRVSVHGLQNVKDFSNHAWGYQVGLLGERLQVYAYRGSSQVQWTKFSSSREPLTWYKTVFDAPSGDEPVALDLGSMGKGETWINGESIGRYWVSFRASDGSTAQRWYNVPRSFLRPTGNLLVIVEEEGGSPLDMSLDIVSTRYV